MIYKTIPKSVIERIPIYLNYLNKIDEDGLISSTTIAQQLGLGEVQVRKDLNLITGKGKPKVGYQVSNLKSDLNKLIFDDKLINVVIIGAGKIGSALAKYHGFNENSFKIVGIFDNSPEKIGRTINEYVNSYNFDTEQTIATTTRATTGLSVRPIQNPAELQLSSRPPDLIMKFNRMIRPTTTQAVVRDSKKRVLKIPAKKSSDNFKIPVTLSL